MKNIELNSTYNLRRAVLIGMCTLLGCLSFLLGIINLSIAAKWVTLGFIELLYALCSFTLAVLAVKRRHQFWQVILYIFALTTIVIYAVSLSKTIGSMICWVLVLPTVYYLLLGKKFANLPVIILFFAVVANIISKYGFTVNPLLVNFVFSYLLIWAVSHIYEKNRANSEVKLQKLALQDPLTLSYNRLALTKYFENVGSKPSLQELDEELHLLILDIDFFKQVNDKYGHAVGDTVLQESAKIISRIAGDKQTFRIGGEEFCVLIENKNQDEAIALAQLIRTQLAKNAFKLTEHQHINITVSIGFSSYQPGMALANLLRQADQRLYNAKHSGRNQVIFNNNPLAA
ncbi:MULTISPECIES: GGDEF domain-containing protein [unclassified Shewanella]|uniref:GGDEF domain-containing protein n=1 Tax=unclassified Shewanella TaxID=196818 RepID=UPI001BB85A5B|nr:MULTISPECIES: GGDEF domain-containing protein [unclassified Shewanella]GIU05671.1 GGDEF domain-containing protein [Shewanella sp. MBTL60-112-B1]GIU25953.1 GGDEF domain-containing protein [Shewanella sp. MBTL60-112-B2]